MAASAEIERPLQLNAWGYDENDMGLVAESLTEDAVLIFSPDEQIEDAAALGGERRTIGREAILAQMSASRAGFEERGEQPRHVITNILIERATDEEADVRCFYVFCTQSAEGLKVHGVSRYFDQIVNDGGTWRIKVRRNVVAHVGSRRPAAGG